MRMEFPNRAAAQAFCDAVHQKMIAANPEYAGAVSRGETTAYAKPYQDLDENDNPISTSWFVNAKPRYQGVMTAGERAQLKPFRAKA